MEMSAKDLRELAGFGYSALFAYTDQRQAQFLRNAAHLVGEAAESKTDETGSLKLYPTATAHALLAFLDIGAFPSRAHFRLNDTDRSSKNGMGVEAVAWNSRTHAHVTAVEGASCMAPYYHDFFARICSEKANENWLEVAAGDTSHNASNDEPFLPLVMFGHLIPAAVFLVDNLLQTCRVGFLSEGELKSLSDGLKSGIDRIRGCLGYGEERSGAGTEIVPSDTAAHRFVDLDREHCHSQFGSELRSGVNSVATKWREAVPTYFIMNACCAANAINQFWDVLRRYEERVTENDGDRSGTSQLLSLRMEWSKQRYHNKLKQLCDDLVVCARRRFERCMASRGIPDDSEFDPAGLAFALRALCLFDKEFRQTPLFREAVRAIVDAQLDDGCWPDGAATSSIHGTAGVQPSVEIAYCLAASLYSRDVRVTPAVADIEAFEIAMPALQRHARYLELTKLSSKVPAPRGKDKETTITGSSGGDQDQSDQDHLDKEEYTLNGWSNDRAKKNSNPEVWITSLAVRFLHFASLIVEAAERSQIMLQYNGSAIARSRPHESVARQKMGPVEKFRDEIYEPDAVAMPQSQLITNFIKPVAVKLREQRYIVRPAAWGTSFLLFGPPRSGKTFLVKQLAKSLGWPLVTIDPANFTRGEGESVGAMISRVFDDLKRLHDAVVLFDECDELVASRGGDQQNGNGSLPFITSALLTRLSELHDRRGPIFCFATNYYYRIDRAARGVGRFDQLVFMDRPDFKARMNFVRKTWSRLAKKDKERHGRHIPSECPPVLLHSLAKNTAGSSYIEIERSVRSVGLELFGSDGVIDSLVSGGNEDREQKMTGRIVDSWINRSGSIEKVISLIRQESPSREDYFRWCESDGLWDLDAVEGDRFDTKCRNRIVIRWIRAARRAGVDGNGFKRRVKERWDFDVAKRKSPGKARQTVALSET